MANFSIYRRLLVILVGILSFVYLAHRDLGVSFNDNFVEILGRADGLYGFATAPIERFAIEPLLEWLRLCGFNYSIHGHWKYEFILLWLIFGSVARAYSPKVASFASVMPTVTAKAFFLVLAALEWVTSGSCALIGGVLAGSVPLNDIATLWWPTFAMILYIFLNSIEMLGVILAVRYSRNWKNIDKLEDAGIWLRSQIRYFSGSAIISFALSICIILLCTFKDNFHFSWFYSDTSVYIASINGLYLYVIAGVAFYFGIYGLILGATNSLSLPEWTGDFRSTLQNEADPPFQRWSDSPATQSGINLLAVLGGGALATLVAHTFA